MDYKHGYGYTEVLKFFNNNKLSLVPSKWTSMVRKNLFEKGRAYDMDFQTLLLGDSYEPCKECFQSHMTLGYPFHIQSLIRGKISKGQ